MPSISRMASSPFSLISCRARSWRSWRSSREMGVASLLRDCSFASDGGREASSALSAVGRSYQRMRGAAIPAVTPPTSRNRRREIMIPSGLRIVRPL